MNYEICVIWTFQTRLDIVIISYYALFPTLPSFDLDLYPPFHHLHRPLCHEFHPFVVPIKREC